MKRSILTIGLLCLLSTSAFAQMFCPLPGKPMPELSSYETLRQLPVLEHGRIKPVDTYAQNVLLRLSGRRSYDKKPAINWLAGVIFANPKMRDEKIFLINHPEIADALTIEPEKKRRYSYTQLEPHINKIIGLAQKSLAIDEDTRSIVENEIIRLESNIRLFIQLSNSFSFAIPHNDFTLTDMQLKEQLQLDVNRDVFNFIEMVMRANDLQIYLSKLEGSNSESWSEGEQQIYAIVNNIFSWSMLYRNMPLHLVPVDLESNTWQSPWDFIAGNVARPEHHNEILFWADLFHFAAAGDQLEFDLTVKALGDMTNKRIKEAESLKNRINIELMYNDWKLLFWAKVLYLLVFLLCLCGLAFPNRFFYGLCGTAAVGAFGANLIAIIMRIIILDRPPVSNLYETFVFVACVSAITGLLIEKINKKYLGFLITSISGFAFLMIAAKYSTEGDTLQMLVAVLNSNFWLSTHVTTITIGYSGVCVAGIVGHIYLLQAIFKPNDKKLLDKTYGVLLGTLGFGLVMAFLGTNLGGIWADQSWGRFWGWDPKENGALLIILWTAILFHARIAKMIGPLELAAGSVLGIIVVMWAWFGVNLLNVGLHSYGFTQGLATNLIIYVVIELLFLGCVYPIAKRKIQT